MLLVNVNRRSIRLRHYDYATQGAYFITLCTCNRACIFGHVRAGTMHLNEIGMTVQTSWLAIPDHFPDVVLDAFVVMPNHVHGVFFITPPDRVDDDNSMICRGEKSFAPNDPATGTIAQYTHDTAAPKHSTTTSNEHGTTGQLHIPDIHGTPPHGGEKFFAPTENQNMGNPVGIPRDEGPAPGTSRTVGSIVRGFKVGVTKWARQNTRVHTIWQRNYYEHIIRDTDALTSIRRYIALNPQNWVTDEDYRTD